MALAAAEQAAGAPDQAVTVLAAALAAVAERGPAEAAPGLRLRLAQAQQAAGDLAAAEASYRALLAEDPRALPAHVGLVTLLGLQRRYAEAATALVEARALAPDHPALLRAGVRVLQQLGDAEGALELARALDAQGQAQAGDLFLRAELEEATGASEAAQATYCRLVAASPKFWPALNNLAVLLTEAGASGEAVPLAEAARALAPANPAVAHTLGLARLRAGDAEGAAPLLAEAVTQEPENPRYLVHLAEAELALGRPEAARAALDRARAAGLAPAEAAALADRLPR